MLKKNVIQKLVSFGAKKRNLEDISKELAEGWYIASIRPHNEAFLCVLEKRVGGDFAESDVPETLTLKDLLAFSKASKRRAPQTEDA